VLYGRFSITLGIKRFLAFVEEESKEMTMIKAWLAVITQCGRYIVYFA